MIANLAAPAGQSLLAKSLLDSDGQEILNKVHVKGAQL